MNNHKVLEGPERTTQIGSATRGLISRPELV
jgi:hypothetical protein